MKFIYTFCDLVAAGWDLLKTSLNMFYGIILIKRLKNPPVTIFGSARLRNENKYMHQAHDLAHILVKNNIPVLTGGGSGIMEAAHCGAIHQELSIISTLGINVPGAEACVCCGAKKVTARTLYTRKSLLIDHSNGFVVFPGGFGTINEFTEVLTLMHLQILKKMPLILIGTDYWKLFIIWLKEVPIKEEIISFDELDLFLITDDIHEALTLLKTRPAIRE
jgi:uncharacterized protein (TIGR00730 family)